MCFLCRVVPAASAGVACPVILSFSMMDAEAVQQQHDIISGAEVQHQHVSNAATAQQREAGIWSANARPSVGDPGTRSTLEVNMHLV